MLPKRRENQPRLLPSVPELPPHALLPPAPELPLAQSCHRYPVPNTCSNVAYLGSLGLSEAPDSQATQTDQFARANGCTIEKLPTAQPGKHVCTPYKGCKAGFPVTWCSFDGGHDYQPRDTGASSTWVPQAVWDFLSPL